VTQSWRIKLCKIPSRAFIYTNFGQKTKIYLASDAQQSGGQAALACVAHMVCKPQSREGGMEMMKDGEARDEAIQRFGVWCGKKYILPRINLGGHIISQKHRTF
jgi:hypothetical protein